VIFIFTKEYSNMKFYRVLCLIILAFFTLSVMAATASAVIYRVGVSPSKINLGEVERGSSVVGTFYLLTSSPDEFLVDLTANRGNTDFFKSNYQDFIYNYSEEDGSGWMEFLDNPVILKHGGNVETDGGALIKGAVGVNFILSVPSYAEAGWHSIVINPSPSIPPGVGSGANIVTVTPIRLLFNVPGKALREGVIMDVIRGEYQGDRVEVRTFFQNTGTVTITIDGEVEVYNSSGEKISTAKTNSDLVGPEETVTLISYLELEGLEYGEYFVDSMVFYITGFTSKDSSIIISEPTVAPPKITPPTVAAPEISIWWVAIPIVIILAFIYYRRD
jgi:hypothetical protein